MDPNEIFNWIVEHWTELSKKGKIKEAINKWIVAEKSELTYYQALIVFEANVSIHKSTMELLR